MSRLQRIFKKCFNHSDSRVITESIGGGTGSQLDWVTLNDVAFEETESGSVASLTSEQYEKIKNSKNIRITDSSGIKYRNIYFDRYNIYIDSKVPNTKLQILQ